MDEKYQVSSDFLNSSHGKQACVECHGGDATAKDKDAAHKAVVRDPSTDSQAACGGCHSKEVALGKSSLHTTLGGFQTALAARGAQMTGAVKTGFDNHCAKCHTSCGQCHVSRPTNLNGGLLSGHEFKKTPPIKEVCTACHATRVAPEYLGNNANVPGDVHWTRAGMTCTKCHSSELHGSDRVRADRYDGKTVECETCHARAQAANVPQHVLHGDKLSCQVCHSVPYKNCSACHVGIDRTGAKYFKTEEPEIEFKIGLNPLRSDSRPYKYVPVRHAPASPELFDYYSQNLLPSFDDVPTWKYATPHNIQRVTPQNKSCDNCHGHPELFLQPSDVAPGEAKANHEVIVTAAPAKVGQ